MEIRIESISPHGAPLKASVSPPFLVPERGALSFDGSPPFLTPEAEPHDSGGQHMKMQKGAMDGSFTGRVGGGFDLDEEVNELAERCGGDVLEDVHLPGRGS